MRLKWWIIINALVFYMPIPLFIWFGQKELAIYCAEGGTFCILGTLLLYAMGIREMPLNPFNIPKVILEQRGVSGYPKGSLMRGILTVIATIALIILLIILDIPHPFYP
ncbi:MAG: hypothetical protein QMC78_06235 [Methanocellales archaeon]|nr:hypothetical protein [Methanocellales archaeon]